MNDRLIGMVLGAAIAVVAVSLLGLVNANINNEAEEYSYMLSSGWGHGMMMHGWHEHDDEYDNDEHMYGCPMMDGWNKGELTIEEMDQDGDGFCDMCGMPVEDCMGMLEYDGPVGYHHDL